MLSHLHSSAVRSGSYALLAAVFLLAGFPAEAADLDLAARALEEGNYEAAYREVQPLAEQGDKTARFVAALAKAMMEAKEAEENRLVATGPIDLREYDERYRPKRSEVDQARFEKGMELYESGRFETALQEWLPLAEAGDAEAQYEVGRLFSAGKGVEKDKERARGFILRSAQQGYGAAQGDLAVSTNPFGYSNEEALQREAFYWGMRAAANGEPWGYEVVSSAYCYGEGVDRNPVLADIWLYLVFSEKNRFLSYACSNDVEYGASYHQAIKERAEALSKAYDIPMPPQN
ncbi:hypothetical protein AAFN88_12845 [Pelagibius sp. CAU 1746]|uniref:tetratricopeptide repeat protein n=1 Tax=Pelagibius sp. CAU 1746 TaxID=3140370 RepID=UPI00325AD8AD